MSLALAMPLWAQDNNSVDCRANAGGPGWDCSGEELLPETEEASDASALIEEARAARAAGGRLDWVPIDAVPDLLHDPRCLSCAGRYLDPLADVDRSIIPEEADIEASATETSLQGSSVTLSGGVVVTQGYRQLQGDTATFNRDTQEGSLSGNIVVREPGVLFTGDRADFNSKTSEASIEGSEFVLHEMNFRGSAQQLQRDTEGLIHIVDGSLSYCAPDSKDWSMSANSMELDIEEGVGVARGAKINLGGVPVFYAPWLRFPLNDDRRTGLLWPSVGSDSKGGVDIATPVYLNIAPNYDALYIPRYIQERGVNHELELRHLNRYLGQWSVGGSYMADDKRYEDEFPDERNHDRWLGLAKHNGLFNQRWRSKVDYAKASDANYLKDLDNSNLDTKRQTSLLQLGSVDYLGDNWLFEAQVQQFQSLADDINNDYKKLPQLTGSYRSDGETFAIEPILLAQYSDFDTDDDRVTGQRLYAEAGVGYPMVWGYGFLKPTVKYRQLDYALSDPLFFTDEKNPSSGAALASVDSGLYFERPLSISNESMVHTLEPRLYYLYSDFEDQTDQPDFDSAELTFNYNQLFRETRFSGRDRIDDANQMSLGVTTRFIGDSNGQEYFNASVGQIFYFEDRRVRLNPLEPPMTQSGSELAAEVSFSPIEEFGVRGNVLWDPYSGEINAGNLQASYTLDNGSLLNAGYTYRRPAPGVFNQPVTEQTHLSAYLPLWSPNWRLFGAWNYSIEAATSIEDMVGVEYDTCCWRVRLLHLRYFDNVSGSNPDFGDPDLERENSTQVQIVLKGMGGFGSRVTGIMQDMIRGFEEREY
ncbi:MAG: LPS-assembly protein LptD [Halioglobus sp.]